MRRVTVLAVLLLAGCGKELTPEEQAMEDERDIAMVEAANDTKPPLELVTPEPILAPDVDEFDMSGAGCNYAPGTSLGARVIAREADAFIKIDGKVQRLAADPGSRELPLHTRSLYNGKEHSVRLTVEGEGRSSGGRHPTSPWGKREGSKTRKRKKQSNKLIVRGRKRGKATQ